MTAIKNKIFAEDNASRGASIFEVLMVMAVVAILAPFMYRQISDASGEIRDVSVANKIIKTRDSALNFVRMYQDAWPDYAQIKLDTQELDQITPDAHAAFIDKYQVRGATITDIYLAFNINNDPLRAAQIAKHIGGDAATVGPDGIAYGSNFAVTAPEFADGDLVYRINYNFTGDDISKYLHRGSDGEDDYSTMFRTLNMGGFNVFNSGTVAANSSKVEDTTAAFTESKEVASSAMYFTSGANMDGSGVKFGTMRITGDITGFRTISAGKLNRTGFSTNGHIISDRGRVNNSIHVGRNLNIKSDSTRTISGFVGVTTHSLATPYLSVDELTFYNNFGLTVSGELLMSTTSPIKIGNWYFPSTTPPKFSNFALGRATIPSAPNKNEFEILTKSGWKNVPSIKQ